MATSTIMQSDNLQQYVISFGGSADTLDYNCPNGLYLVYGLSPTNSSCAMFLCYVAGTAGQCKTFLVYENPSGNSKLSVAAAVGKITVTQSAGWFTITILRQGRVDTAPR